jgi:hypothetical protein
MRTDPRLTAKTWQREWLQGINAVGLVFVIIVLPTAILLSAGLSRPIVLWGSFIGAIIVAPLFLIWQERKQHGINIYKLEERSKASTTDVEAVNPEYSDHTRFHFISQFIIFERFLHELIRLRKPDLQTVEFPSVGELIHQLKIYNEPALTEIRRIINLRNQIAHDHMVPDTTYIEEARLSIERILIELLEDSREDVRTAARRAMELDH